MRSNVFPITHVLERIRALIRWGIFIPQSAIERWRLAIAFGRNRLSTTDAQDIVCRCEPVAGWYPLTTLCTHEAVEHALESYEDHPALAHYIAMGCARVGRKYDSDGEALHYTRQWALEEAVDYAKQDGIIFHPRCDNPEIRP